MKLWIVDFNFIIVISYYNVTIIWLFGKKNLFLCNYNFIGQNDRIVAHTILYSFIGRSFA